MIQFTLTMPSRGSWDGRWSGEEKLYAVIKRLTKKKEDQLDGQRFYHNWSDGWGANITCKKVDAKEAAKVRKKSSGFCGYNWMIDNIVWYGSTNDKQEATCVA